MGRSARFCRDTRLQTIARYAAEPSPEVDLPNHNQIVLDYSAWFTSLRSAPNLEINAEIQSFQATLQMDTERTGGGQINQ
jgi:hypothetical protein